MRQTEFPVTKKQRKSEAQLLTNDNPLSKNQIVEEINNSFKPTSWITNPSGVLPQLIDWGRCQQHMWKQCGSLLVPIQHQMSAAHVETNRENNKAFQPAS